MLVCRICLEPPAGLQLFYAASRMQSTGVRIVRGSMNLYVHIMDNTVGPHQSLGILERQATWTCTELMVPSRRV